MAIVYRSGDFPWNRSEVEFRIELQSFILKLQCCLSVVTYFFVALELFDYVCTFAFLTVSPSCKYYASFTRTASSVFDEEAI